MRFKVTLAISILLLTSLLAGGAGLSLAEETAPGTLAGSWMAVPPTSTEATIGISDWVFLPGVMITLSSEPPQGMVHIPAGEFQMGCDQSNPNEYCYSNELPLHTVYLSAYHIDIHEVTNDQYAAFLNGRTSNWCTGYECVDLDDPESHITYQGGHYIVEPVYGDHPVIEASWYGAAAFCTESGKRLPSEAEWEKAARGVADTRRFPWGNEPADCSRANFYDDDYCVGDTTPVGSYPTGASPYGALDMAGNVLEWINDWHDGLYYQVSPYANPPGPPTGGWKVMRGGTLHFTWYGVRVATRHELGEPTNTRWYVGFRCASGPG